VTQLDVASNAVLIAPKVRTVVSPVKFHPYECIHKQARIISIDVADMLPPAPWR
jgi:hypothetical protein